MQLPSNIKHFKADPEKSEEEDTILNSFIRAELVPSF